MVLYEQSLAEASWQSVLLLDGTDERSSTVGYRPQLAVGTQTGVVLHPYPVGSHPEFLEVAILLQFLDACASHHGLPQGEISWYLICD